MPLLSLLKRYASTHCDITDELKDEDSLNTILGYAKHVEGTQHSEHLSKVYLDTI